MPLGRLTTPTVKSNCIYASIRYRQKAEKGILKINENKFIFKEPQRAVAEGQSIVFYDEDICLGGAVIDN